VVKFIQFVVVACAPVTVDIKRHMKGDTL